MRVIETELPLSMEVVSDFYADKENTVFRLNYKESAVKGSAFVNYCANLELNATIDFSDTDFKEKCEIVKAVMENPVISELQDIVCEIGQMLLYLRGVEIQLLPPDKQLFSGEQRVEFIKDNPKLFLHWLTFFNSLLVFMFSIIQVTEDENKLPFLKNKNIKEVTPRITDANFVGKSVITLMQRPSFIEAFFSVPVDNDLLCYLDVQFEEYCYKQKNLYHYFATEDNIVLITALYEIFKNDPKYCEPDAAGEEAK